MDRKFMEDYYWLKYQDGFMVKAIESDEECRGVYHNVIELEGKIEAIMRKEGEDCLLSHRKLFVAKGELDELVMRLAYLQGAEDREKMLR